MSRTMAETQAKQMTRTLSAALADNSPSKTTNYLYGRIQSFRADFGVGVIAAGDGRKYRFACRDLINAQFDLEGQHVHFIDGADGGYAIAAQQLKAQFASKT